MKHAAKPPISEMTRPISGMKRARINVRQNQTSVCSILRLRSLATSVSTSSPLKRNHKPSSTALKHKQIHIFSLHLTINMHLSQTHTHLQTTKACYLPQKCRIGYEVTTQMMMKARAMATAMSSDGYDIKTSWLTLEPNDRKPQTPAEKNKPKRYTTSSHQHDLCFIIRIFQQIEAHTPVPVYTKRQMIMLSVTTAHQGRISGFFMLLKTGTLLT